MTRPRAWNSTLPARPVPMGRGKGLARTDLQAGTGLARTPAGPRLRRAPIRPVSAKRAAANRVRVRMVDALWPGSRGDGQDRPLCVVYELSQAHPGAIPAKVLAACGRWADDVHEPLSRARLGSITDPGNATAPCRCCHDAITPGPPWALALGLVEHSWGGEPDAA